MHHASATSPPRTDIHHWLSQPRTSTPARAKSFCPLGSKSLGRGLTVLQPHKACTRHTRCHASSQDSESQLANTEQEPTADKAGKAQDATRWQVPWGGGQVARLMLQIWALEAISVPLLTQLRGLSLAETSFSDKAVSAAAVQFLKLLGAVLIVRRGLTPYKPLPPKWKRYRLNAEALGLGVSGGVTALCLTLLTAAATGGAAAQNTGTVTTLLGDGQAITVTAIGAASILGAPVLEEYTYRGFLLPSLTKWMQTPAAVLTQAVIFAGSHLSAGDLVPLTALGVCLGTVTVAAEGNLVAPTLAHVLYNAAILYNIVK
ncbi:hypothetical protein ABBQ38_011032 [Trebouxia sp. C0009 RCD-2024]